MDAARGAITMISREHTHVVAAAAHTLLVGVTALLAALVSATNKRSEHASITV